MVAPFFDFAPHLVGADALIGPFLRLALHKRFLNVEMCQTRRNSKIVTQEAADDSVRRFFDFALHLANDMKSAATK